MLFFLNYVVLFLTEARFVGDKVIYSQIDMTRKKTSSPSGLSLGGLSGGSSGGGSGGSSGCPAASGGNKGHNHLTVVHGGGVPVAVGGPGNARGGQPTSYSTASTASDHSDPLSWAPLLGNRSGPESSLWWKITHFHAPILLQKYLLLKNLLNCVVQKVDVCFLKWWKSEQRNIFVKLKMSGYSFWLLKH